METWVCLTAESPWLSGKIFIKAGQKYKQMICYRENAGFWFTEWNLLKAFRPLKSPFDRTQLKIDFLRHKQKWCNPIKKICNYELLYLGRIYLTKGFLVFFFSFAWNIPYLWEHSGNGKNSLHLTVIGKLEQVKWLPLHISRPRRVSVTQSCPTLFNPVDCSPPGSSVHGISQARILELVAISSSRILSFKNVIHN